eukprot:g1575.t1
MKRFGSRRMALFGPGKLLLAPMVRGSHLPLRLLALREGCHTVYSPEIIDHLLATCTRVVNPTLRTIDYVVLRDGNKKSGHNVSKKKKYKNRSPRVVFRTNAEERGKVILQLGTGSPATAIRAMKVMFPQKEENGGNEAAVDIDEQNLSNFPHDVAGVDVNMGCPKHFSIQGGMGASLLSDLPRAASIIKALRDYLPPQVTVSAKIRYISTPSSSSTSLVSKEGQTEKEKGAEHERHGDSLYDTTATATGSATSIETQTVEFCSGLIANGADSIAIHMRTRSQRPSDMSDWSKMKGIVKELRNRHPDIPLSVNGDIMVREDIDLVRKETGADSVMVARAALDNFSIFRQPLSKPMLDQASVLKSFLECAKLLSPAFTYTKYVCQQILIERSRSRIPSIFYSGRKLQMVGEGLKGPIGKELAKARSHEELQSCIDKYFCVMTNKTTKETNETNETNEANDEVPTTILQETKINNLLKTAALNNKRKAGSEEKGNHIIPEATVQHMQNDSKKTSGDVKSTTTGNKKQKTC